jgi:phosphatidylglycerophosphatase A
MTADSEAALPDATNTSHTTTADSPSSPAAAQRKPRFALFIATACGLGYMPVAPGTWGSLAGLALFAIPACSFFWGEILYMLANAPIGDFFVKVPEGYFNQFVWAYVILFVLVSAIGVWTADRAARFWRDSDPQRVVIDEVSGQFLTILVGCGVPVWWKVPELRYATMAPGFIIMRSALNWKYLLLGFILVRVFDIWKPFPARQAESLPGGWGIMADDWIASVYAAIGLWLARAAGL